MASRTYQGSPCNKGHDGTRYRSNSACVECARINSQKQYLPAAASLTAERADAQRFIDAELQLARGKLAEAARHLQRARSRGTGFRNLWRDSLVAWAIERKLAEDVCEFSPDDWLGEGQ